MKRLTEQEVIERLKTIQIEPLEINYQSIEGYLPFGNLQPKYRPDLLVNIKWESKIFRFIAEIKTVATPKLLENAISQLDFYLNFFKNREFSDEYYPMVITPYLSAGQIKELVSNKISGIDLSGNAALIVPSQLLILKTGNPNKFPSTESIKNVYRWSSSIVARVFLSRPEYSTVSEVYDEIINREGKIALGTVSKVLKTMEEDFFISRQAGIKLIEAEGLLSRLAENYRTKGKRKAARKVSDLDLFIKQLMINCERSQTRVAINQPQQYAVFPTIGTPTKVYVEDIDKGFEGIIFEETDRFANLDLLETNEPSYFFDRQLVDGIFYTSPVQTYLDLMKGGKREQDTAEQIKTSILNSLKGKM